MSTYEPGQVCVATVDGEPNVRIAYADPADLACPWFTISGKRVAEWFAADQVTDIRPLVALDLDDPNLYGCSAVAHDPAKIVAALMDTNSVAAHGIARQIEQQTKPPFVPRFRLGGLVRFTGSPTESEPWTKRRTEKHLGIVVENFGDGEVRIYDTVEHDWWQCDETRLTPFEDGAS